MAIAIAALAPAARSAGDEFVIAREGRATAAIIVPHDAKAMEREAAEELRRVIGVMTGSEPDLAVEPGPARSADGGTIEVGRTIRALAAGLPPRDLAPDGFTVKTAEGRLFLTGANPWSTAFAVAWLLEKEGGARWFFPGPLGETIPRRAGWSVPALDIREEPAFQVRDFTCLFSGGDGPGAGEREEFRRWAWHNRATLEGDSLGPWGGFERHPRHAPSTWFPGGRGLEGHPGWIALAPWGRESAAGWMNWQLCTTDSALQRWVVDRAVQSFQRSPRLPVFSVSPNDLRGWCQCRRCLALDAGDPDWASRPHELSPDSGGLPAEARPGAAMSRRVFTFAADIARRVAAGVPGARIGCYAYNEYRLPPRDVEIPANLEIWYAQCSGSYFEPELTRTQRGGISDWSRAGAPLFVYEYFGDFRTRAPRLYPHDLAADLAWLHDAGVRGVHTESMADWGAEGLDYYLAARCLWDPKTTADAVLDEWCRGLFGAAAPEMQAYFAALETRWRSAQPDGQMLDGGSLARMLERYPEDAVRELDGDLERARTAAPDSLTRERVAFFGHALDYVRLYHAGEALGPSIRGDRGRTGLLSAEANGAVTEIANAMPPGADPGVRARAAELRRREEAMRRDPALARVFSPGALEVTDREFHGGLGERAPDALAWKYWLPADPGDATPARVSADEYARMASALGAKSGGRNAAKSRARGASVEVDATVAGGAAPGVLVNGVLTERGWQTPEAPWSDQPAERAGWRGHEVRLRWSHALTFDTVVLDWGEEGKVSLNARDFRLDAEVQGTWRTLADVRGRGEEFATALVFPPVRADALRLTVGPEAGPPLRPNLLWLREIEVY